VACELAGYQPGYQPAPPNLTNADIEELTLL